VLTPVDNAEASPSAPAPFEITRRELDARTGVISVEGDLDLSSAPRLKWMLLDAFGEGLDQLVLDLSRTSFMDSTALGVLVAFKRSLDSDSALAVVCAGANVRKIFELSGMDRVFPIFADLTDAVAHAQGHVAQAG
jgi:anti-sigma B factor antagonist